MDEERWKRFEKSVMACYWQPIGQDWARMKKEAGAEREIVKQKEDE